MKPKQQPRTIVLYFIVSYFSEQPQTYAIIYSSVTVDEKLTYNKYNDHEKLQLTNMDRSSLGSEFSI